MSLTSPKLGGITLIMHIAVAAISRGKKALQKPGTNDQKVSHPSHQGSK